MTIYLKRNHIFLYPGKNNVTGRTKYFLSSLLPSGWLMADAGRQGVTKRCSLSWLTNRALVFEPKCGGGGSWVESANEYSSAVHRSPNKLWRSNSIFNLWPEGISFCNLADNLAWPVKAIETDLWQCWGWQWWMGGVSWVSPPPPPPPPSPGNSEFAAFESMLFLSDSESARLGDWASLFSWNERTTFKTSFVLCRLKVGVYLL